MHYFFYKVRWYVGIALLLCAGITVMKYSAALDRWLFGTAKQPPVVSQQTAQSPSQPSPVTTASPATATDVRVQLAEANSLLSEASSFATEALKKVRVWQRDIEPMQNNRASEAVVDQDDLFEKLAFVFREDRIGASEIRDASARVDALRVKVNDLTKQANPSVLSATEMAEVSELHDKCRAAHEEWDLAVQRGLAIKRSIANPPIASETPPSIGDKIEEANARQTLADLDEQIEDDKKQKEEERKRLVELEKQKLLEKQRAAELLEQATSPEVTAVLAPFLEPRSIQPSLSGTFSIRFLRTAEKKPMSLRNLMSIGVLDNSVPGRKKLALVGGNRKLPEPKWSIASQEHNWSSEDEEFLKQAQKFLREYGPALVQAGKLSE